MDGVMKKNNQMRRVGRSGVLALAVIECHELLFEAARDGAQGEDGREEAPRHVGLNPACPQAGGPQDLPVKVAETLAETSIGQGVLLVGHPAKDAGEDGVLDAAVGGPGVIPPFGDRDQMRIGFEIAGAVEGGLADPQGLDKGVLRQLPEG